jgi:hypothetical protein
MKKKSALLLGCTFLACMAISLNCKGQNLKYLWLTATDMTYLIKQTTKDKIHFQFFHDKSNTLTLYGWPERDVDNDDTEHRTLNIGTGPASIDLKGKDILLATLNLGKKRIKALSDAINDKKYKSIIFDPVEYEPIDGSVIIHVYYKIYGSFTDDGSDLKGKGVTKADPITTTKNPSPPRQAN